MKKIFYLAIIVSTIGISISLKSQTVDTLDNFFSYYNHMMAYFEGQASQKSIMYYEVDGWKEFTRWKNSNMYCYDEYGSITAYAEAVENYYTNNTDNLPSELPTWEYIGHEGVYPNLNNTSYDPAQGQGNINRIWVNPNNADSILAGGNRGSLWRTYDGGDNWECISDTHPLMDGHASIEVNPDDHNEIYVAQRYRGISFGLFHTTNGGISWTQNKVHVPSQNKDYYPSGNITEIPIKWIVNPNNSQIMYLITPKYVFRSTDGGLNWDIIFNKDYFYHSHEQGMKDIEFDPVDPSIFYVTGTDAYRFTNNGNDTLNITNNLIQWSINLNGYYRILTGTQPEFPDKIWFTVFSYEDNINPNKLTLVKHNKQNVYELLASKSGVNTGVGNKIQCEISPKDTNKILLGGIATYLYDSIGISDIASYSCPSNWTHVDVRDGKFLVDENDEEFIIIGNDGSVFRTDYNQSTDNWNWTYLGWKENSPNGIQNGDLHGFDCSNSENDILYAGFQDMGSSVGVNGQWYKALGGDGGPGVIDKTDSRYIYGSKYNSPAVFSRSTDPVPSFSWMFSNTTLDRPPVVLNPINPNELFVGDLQLLRKFTNARTSNSYVPILTDVIIENDDPAYDYYGDLNVTEVAICETNDNIIYASTNRYFPGWGDPPPVNSKSIFKTVDGGQNWTDLTQNLISALQYQQITGIAINPYNEDEVWVCFGSSGSVAKVFHSTDAGLTWSAMADGLDEGIPALDLYFDKRGNTLYLTSILGVYFYNTADDLWYNITNDLPTTNINRIRFNYALNKIRVGTRGRGIWQTDIPCFVDNNTLTISSNTTWNTVKHILSDIEIESGAELTITSDLYMSEDKKISIKRGAKLILDGGTITNSCGNLWKGIEVWGNAFQGQSYAFQGVVEITNGGTIENAVCGIETIKYNEIEDGTPNYNFTGGIVVINNGVFKNNKTAIKFWPYNYANSISFAGNCQFITDENLIPGTDPDYFVKLNDISGVRFILSSFTDSRTGLPVKDFTTGINCYDSYINVYSGCEFTELYYGIYATASTTATNIKITDSYFEGNYRGIYIGGMTSPRITSNDFYMENMSSVDCYGLYLDESTDYWVEDNMFQGVSTDGTPKGTAIIVNESGGDPNEIYLNVFNDVEYAINAQGANRDGKYHDVGLVIKCNDYNNTKADETILSSGGAKLPSYSGIAKSQGADSDYIEDMAGNIFYYETSATDYDDINNEANSIYYYFSDDATGYDVEPLDIQLNITVFPKEKETPLWAHETACPSTIPIGGGGEDNRDEGLAKMSEAQTEIDDTEAILTAMIDGGNTEALNTEVETSTPPETAAVYNELMSESPNLSETVVESTIEQETVLPNAMVRDVMVANPHTAKSQQLIDKLDERLDPMPEYMKAQILAGRSIQSLKDELESQLANSKLKKAKAMNDVVRYYKEQETDPTVAYTGLVNLFQDDNTLKSSYRLAWLHLEKGEYQLGSNVLNNIPTQFSLAYDEQLAHEGMAVIYSMLSGLYQNGNTLEDLSESQLSELQTLASGEVLTTRAYARNILMAIGEMEYEEPILFPDLSKSAQAMEDYNKLMKVKAPQQLSVYPNPSNGYVILEYNMEAETDAVLEIKDVNGKTMCTINTTLIQDQVTVTTENWKPGMYIATLKIDGKSIESVKFTLVK